MKSAKNLVGQGIRPGYQSHYVVTDKNGNVADMEQTPLFNEIVLEQESLVVPVYLITTKKMEPVCETTTTNNKDK